MRWRRERGRDDAERRQAEVARVEAVVSAAERTVAGIREEAEAEARTHVREARRRADEASAGRAHELSELADGILARARSVAYESDLLLGWLEEVGRAMSGGWKPFPPRPTPSLATAAGGGRQVPAATPGQAPGARPALQGRSGAEPSLSTPAPTGPAQAGVAAGPPGRAIASQGAGAPVERSGEAAGEPTDAGRPQVSEGARLLATQMAVSGVSGDEIARRLQDEFDVGEAEAVLEEIGIPNRA